MDQSQYRNLWRWRALSLHQKPKYNSFSKSTVTSVKSCGWCRARLVKSPSKGHFYISSPRPLMLLALVMNCTILLLHWFAFCPLSAVNLLSSWRNQFEVIWALCFVSVWVKVPVAFSSHQISSASHLCDVNTNHMSGVKQQMHKWIARRRSWTSWHESAAITITGILNLSFFRYTNVSMLASWACWPTTHNYLIYTFSSETPHHSLPFFFFSRYCESPTYPSGTHTCTFLTLLHVLTTYFITIFRRIFFFLC